MSVWQMAWLLPVSGPVLGTSPGVGALTLDTRDSCASCSAAFRCSTVICTKSCSHSPDVEGLPCEQRGHPLAVTGNIRASDAPL